MVKNHCLCPGLQLPCSFSWHMAYFKVTLKLTATQTCIWQLCAPNGSAPAVLKMCLVSYRNFSLPLPSAFSTTPLTLPPLKPFPRYSVIYICIHKHTHIYIHLYIIYITVRSIMYDLSKY
jgi:hypothetical protein